MLFTAPVFLFAFLPVTLGVFLLLRRFGRFELCVPWLFVASCVFYAWWSAFFVLVLLVSMTLNYYIGRAIEFAQGSRRRPLFAIAIVGNLSLLAYFKYADFFIGVVNDVSGADHPLLHIVLPLGISFFTFQKIAYVTDIYVGKAKTGRFIDFALFVFFFPQLIAGPIVHHAEVLPQFARLGDARRISDEEETENLAIGLAIFSIGLMKKVLIADQIAPYSTSAFAAAHGAAIGLGLAWQAALCYTMQLYFDFSGYSDMAIGLGRVFGVRLPANFDSPYASTSIIEFWRRWHMTLSRFLRDYVYIPLGGNRDGEARRYLNLFLTMLLGGLWHGAAYTFVIWGALHGLYLLIAHAWCASPSAQTGASASRAAIIVGWLLTMLAVIVGWVFFRAASVPDALNIVAGMAGLHGVSRPAAPGALIAALLLIIACAIAPNTQQIMRAYRPTLYGGPPSRFFPRFAFAPTLAWAAFVGFGLIAVELFSWETSEFIYFQF